jgi:hypothetical protein
VWLLLNEATTSITITLFISHHLKYGSDVSNEFDIEGICTEIIKIIVVTEV